MLVQEVLEEIIEKLPDNTLSVPSILRKITTVRDELIRSSGAAQQHTDAVVSSLDLLQGVSQYPLPCPASNIIDVDVQWGDYVPGAITDNYGFYWVRLPMKQFNQRGRIPYYYILAGTIGIYPTPDVTREQGIKIFHLPVIAPLTINDLSAGTGFDPNYDMTLVFGVLKDVTTGAQQSRFTEQYERWAHDYRSANNGNEQYVIKERW
ncbi:hypothetical protein WMW72_10620 [Paenibacillus filicis]|uniref:Uncharacterized protein n=1 Tax=Paenibacillus filicis TaxID=669464 RepID=A0ABU9DJE1_9BACL